MTNFKQQDNSPEELKPSYFLAVESHSYQTANSLQKEVLSYLKTLDRRLIPAYDLENFYKEVSDHIDELNNQNKRCNPISIAFKPVTDYIHYSKNNVGIKNHDLELKGFDKISFYLRAVEPKVIEVADYGVDFSVVQPSEELENKNIIPHLELFTLGFRQHAHLLTVVMNDMIISKQAILEQFPIFEGAFKAFEVEINEKGTEIIASLVKDSAEYMKVCRETYLSHEGDNVFNFALAVEIHNQINPGHEIMFDGEFFYLSNSEQRRIEGNF